MTTLDGTTTARAAVYDGPESMTITRFPLPALASGDMLVEVLLCGVDGSELHMYRGEVAWLDERAPVIFGDEIVGRVVALGDGTAAARSLAVGDRVVIESRWPCSGCRTCDLGQYYLCENRSPYDGYGTFSSASAPHLWGGYSTHVYVPAAALVYPVPESMSDDTALVACSPLANGIRWIEAGHVRSGDHVAVVGPGAQGLSCALAATALGATVTVIGLDTDRARLDMAASFDRTSVVAIAPGDSVQDTIEAVQRVGGPVDVAVETAGALSAKQLALGVVRPLGAVVNVSMTSPGAQPVDWAALTHREVTLYNPVSHPHAVERGFALAQSLLESGLDVGTWVTNRFSLEDAVEALETVSYHRDARPIKVVLDLRA